MSTETSNQQSTTINITEKLDTICCPPKDQSLWNQHPRVYLDLKASNEATCPYCGNHFKRQLG